MLTHWRAISQRAAKTARVLATDILYPPRCAGCGRRGRWLCAICDRELARFAEPWCGRCGVPSALGACRCATLPEAVAAVRSVASFDGWLRAAIIHFKYHQEWARKDQLGEVLVSPLSSLPGVDLLVPVPLHQTRQTRRGYNQSALLAHRVGAQLGLPVAETLIRARETAQQVGLGGADRQRNVAGAFEVIGYPDLIGKRLVLVDDVITTGATLAACAEPLLAAGATDIRAVTLAREL